MARAVKSGLAIVHHPDFSIPLPDGHRFPMGKFNALMEPVADRRSGGVR